MRRRFLLILTVFAVLSAIAVSIALLARNRPPEISPRALRADYLRQVDSLDLILRPLAALPTGTDAVTAQAAFRRARAAYKRIEYLVEG